MREKIQQSFSLSYLLNKEHMLENVFNKLHI